MDRRQLLAAVAGAGTLVLAGCLGDEGETPSNDAGDGGGNSAATDETRLVEDEEFPPVDEPASAPAEALCGVCNMTPADYPHANAQAAHENEARQFFCSPGCLVTYAVATDQLAETDSPLATMWARDADHEGLVVATELYWVLDTDVDRGIDPMRNPLPYENRDDAAEWVKTYDDLSEDDIVAFEDITLADAEEYRAFYIG